MNQLSDADTSDSEDGIRFKTHSVRAHLPRAQSERRPDHRSHCSSSRRPHRKSPSRSPSRDRERHRSKREKRHRKSKSRHSPSSRRRKRDRSGRRSNEQSDETRTLSSNSSKSSQSSKKDDNKAPQKHKEGADTQTVREEKTPLLTTELLAQKTEQTAQCVAGPVLPRHLSQNKEKPDKLVVQEKEEDSCSVIVGPALPAHMKEQQQQQKQQRNENGASEKPESSFVAPPIMLTKQTIIRPPSSCGVNETAKTEDPAGEDQEVDDEEVFGPLPPGTSGKTSAHIALEERALQMRIDMLGPKTDEKDRREEWMIELPSAKASGLGLTARQFRPNAGPDMSDRSSWTDTPTDKQKKKKSGEKVTMHQLKREAEANETSRRDEEQEEMIKRSKKKRNKDKSLLELHQEKLKKEKKKSDAAGNTRRPFSRDIDLKVNHFDEAQKKSILKKAQLLDDRFSKGQAKYL